MAFREEVYVGSLADSAFSVECFAPTMNKVPSRSLVLFHHQGILYGKFFPVVDYSQSYKVPFFAMEISGNAH